MAGNNSIQFLRGNNIGDSSEVLLPGQPMYDMATGYLRIGNGGTIASTSPIKAHYANSAGSASSASSASYATSAGSASSATKVGHNLKITVGGSTYTFDGSANTNISISSIANGGNVDYATNAGYATNANYASYANSATYADRLGNRTVGSPSTPVYFSSGVPYECSSIGGRSFGNVGTPIVLDTKTLSINQSTYSTHAVADTLYAACNLTAVTGTYKQVWTWSDSPISIVEATSDRPLSISLVITLYRLSSTAGYKISSVNLEDITIFSAYSNSTTLYANDKALNGAMFGSFYRGVVANIGLTTSTTPGEYIYRLNCNGICAVRPINTSLSSLSRAITCSQKNETLSGDTSNPGMYLSIGFLNAAINTFYQGLGI